MDLEKKVQKDKINYFFSLTRIDLVRVAYIKSIVTSHAPVWSLCHGTQIWHPEGIEKVK